MPGALARFGLFAAVAGAAIGLVLVILDRGRRETARPGVGERGSRWKGHRARPGPRQRDHQLRLASLFNFVFAAATFILFGLAVALSGVYPRWLGWIVFVAGVASIGAGLIQAYVGEPTGASRIPTIFGPTVITLWLLVIGILLVRMRRSESMDSR